MKLYLDEYNDKMKALLDDRDSYRTSRTDATFKLLTTNNNMVLNNHIALHTKVSKTVRLPKIHKIGVPLRP